MSAETSFLGIKDVLIKPVQTIRHLNPDNGLFSVQAITIYFDDGSRHDMTFHFKAGQHALAVGDVVTHDEVTA